jgi:endonuclease/exonuclease/phosphatase family metal-dependent hydrolase
LPPVRLASFNLLHGCHLSDGGADPDRLRRAVASLDATVLGLQEVDRGQPRSGLVDQTALAAEAAGAGWARFQPTLIGTPGGAWRAAGPAGDRDDEPGYGVALVSRLPVRQWHVIRLPRLPVRSPVRLAGGRRRVRLLPDEPRVGLAAELDTDAGPLTVAVTHLSFVPGWNLLQLRRLCAALERLPGPRVLLGDLNLPGPLPAGVAGWRRLATVATYPAARPRIQLDHALGHGSLPAVAELAARALEISDHRALVIDFAPTPDRADPGTRPGR